MIVQSLLLLLLPLLLVAPLSQTPADAAAIGGSKKLPSFVRRCSIKDPELEKCALESGRESLPRLVRGDPSINLPDLEPLSITEIRIQSGTQASPLDMTCRNIVLKGLANTQLERVGIDKKNSIYSAECTIPKLEIYSDYTVDGRVLLLPIKGSGKANFTFENAKLYYEQKYSVEKKGSSYYHKFPPSTAKFNCSRARFQLDNLFNGDKQLGNTVNSFLNENWGAVVDDLGQPFVDAAAQVIRQFAVALVGGIPYEEIFEDVDTP